MSLIPTPHPLLSVWHGCGGRARPDHGHAGQGAAHPCSGPGAKRVWTTLWNWLVCVSGIGWGMAAGLDKTPGASTPWAPWALALWRWAPSPQAPARQPQAAHVQTARGPCTDQPPGVQTMRALMPSSTTCSGLSSAKQHRQPHVAGAEHWQNASTPIENATSDYLACLDGVYPRMPITSPSTSARPTRKTCGLCKATKHWMLCWEPLPSGVSGWRTRSCHTR